MILLHICLLNIGMQLNYWVLVNTVSIDNKNRTQLSYSALHTFLQFYLTMFN